MLITLSLKNKSFVFAHNLFNSVTSKSRQMSIKIAQNDFTSKMIYFDSFTKIA